MFAHLIDDVYLMRRLLQLVVVLVAWRRQRSSSNASLDRVTRELDSIGDRFEEQLSATTTKVLPAFLAGLLGSALLFGALLWGRDRLTTADPPSSSPPAIGFSGPATTVSRRGIVIGVYLQASGCTNPLEVTVVASGTAEYWRSNRRSMPRNGKFVFAVEDATLENVSVGPADALDNLDRTRFTIAPLDPEQKGRISAVSVRRLKDKTIVSGEVVNWRRTWIPVYLNFRANWVQRRSGSSCYVPLPSLTGLGAVAVTDAAPQRDATLLAFNSLTVFGGAIRADASLPGPDQYASLASSWECEAKQPPFGLVDADTLKRGELIPGMIGTKEGLAFTERAFRNDFFGAAGCSGIAAIEESGASAQRDLDLLLLGGAVGLALALVTQGLLVLTQGWLEARSARNLAVQRAERLRNR